MTLNWRSAAVLAAVQVVACTAGSPQEGADGAVLSKWAALSSGSVEATQSIQSDWKSGYCSDITVKNSGSTPVTGWTVVIDLHQSTIGSSHSSKRTGNTFTPESYNATIAPGSSIKFGFCANATGIDYLATIASFSAIGGGGSTSGGGTAGAAGAGASGVNGGAGGARAGAGNAGGGAAGAAAPAGPPGSAGSGGSPGKGGSALLTKTDEWNSGYCADVSVTGSSNWTVLLDMRNSAVESGQLWSASYTTSGNRVTVTGTSSKFRFCARKTATSDWLATVSSVNGGSTGGTGTGGGSAGASGGSAGSSGGSGGSSNGGGATGGSCAPISGTPGWTSRFWDCCKPHCGWSANVSGGNALNSCSAANQSYGTNYSVPSACAGGGSAYMCYGLTPWAVSDTLAYGYAATPTGNDSCGKCYQVQFTGAGQYGNDPGSIALKGKTMIVQTINVGGDVGQNQLDIMVPGGGVGLYNACSSQWGVSNAQLGEQYGGLLATCKKELGYNASGERYKSCLKDKCTGLFTDARGLGQLREGCLFYVDWFQAADNPKMVYKEVSCPAAIQAKSNLRAGAASNNACGG